jgi:hypothetical protein
MVRLGRAANDNGRLQGLRARLLAISAIVVLSAMALADWLL